MLPPGFILYITVLHSCLVMYSVKQHTDIVEKEASASSWFASNRRINRLFAWSLDVLREQSVKTRTGAPYEQKTHNKGREQSEM